MARGSKQKAEGARTKKKKGILRSMKRWQKITLAVFLIIAIVAGSAYGYLNYKLNKVNRIDVKKHELSCVDVDGFANILLVGLDTRHMSDEKGSRTDAIMIASIKEETGEVYLTSIYRDTFIKMAGRNAYDKINHAFAEGGIKETIKTINQAMDLNIDKFAIFNFQAVSDVVNALGGIDVDVKDYEIDEFNRVIDESSNVLRIDTKKIKRTGTQTLDGVQALSYGRMRNGVGDDFKRTERMRVVVDKLLGKLKESSVSTINNAIDKGLVQITTNLSNNDMLALGLNATKYKIVGSKGFPYDVTTGYIDGVSYVFPNTMTSNVIKFHETVFGQKKYKLTSKAARICADIDNKIAGESVSSAPVDVDKVSEDPNAVPDHMKAEGQGAEPNSGSPKTTAPGEPSTDGQPEQGQGATAGATPGTTPPGTSEGNVTNNSSGTQPPGGQGGPDPGQGSSPESPVPGDEGPGN